MQGANPCPNGFYCPFAKRFKATDFESVIRWFKSNRGSLPIYPCVEKAEVAVRVRHPCRYRDFECEQVVNYGSRNNRRDICIYRCGSFIPFTAT